MKKINSIPDGPNTSSHKRLKINNMYPEKEGFIELQLLSLTFIPRKILKAN